ncbi:hypothetical protein HMPREF1615_00673 [Escherichia coli 908632]|nr:hypothetical protein HMPREF1615_00673 [Escherichia coli 908632]
MRNKFSDFSLQKYLKLEGKLKQFTVRKTSYLMSGTGSCMCQQERVNREWQ